MTAWIVRAVQWIEKHVVAIIITVATTIIVAIVVERLNDDVLDLQVSAPLAQLNDQDAGEFDNNSDVEAIRKVTQDLKALGYQSVKLIRIRLNNPPHTPKDAEAVTVVVRSDSSSLELPLVAIAAKCPAGTAARVRQLQSATGAGVGNQAVDPKEVFDDQRKVVEALAQYEKSRAEFETFYGIMQRVIDQVRHVQMLSGLRQGEQDDFANQLSALAVREGFSTGTRIDKMLYPAESDPAKLTAAGLEARRKKSEETVTDLRSKFAPSPPFMREVELSRLRPGDECVLYAVAAKKDEWLAGSPVRVVVSASGGWRTINASLSESSGAYGDAMLNEWSPVQPEFKFYILVGFSVVIVVALVRIGSRLPAGDAKRNGSKIKAAWAKRVVTTARHREEES